VTGLALQTGRSRWIGLSAGAALVALILVAGIAAAGFFFQDFDAGAWIREITGTITAWGPWGVAASIGLMVLHSFIPFPAEFLAIANGMVFGPILGTLVTWLGAMAGAMIAFYLARRLGRPFVQTMLARRQAAWLERWTGDGAANWIFLARFIPVIAFNLINYAAGLTKISWWTFIWTTGVGILPMTVLMVTKGASFHLLDWKWWLALMAGGFLAWLILRRWLKAREVEVKHFK
jgi:uncharacterized membrane protein YdjX (TVP38/TMEM64 family)